MSTENNNFSSHGTISNPESFLTEIQAFPDDISETCEHIQALLIHVYWIEKYGVKIDDSRQLKDMQSRTVDEICSRLISMDDSSLIEGRPPQNRVVSTCRDFSLILCSILRSKGVPARLRCGFATYFAENYHMDHWVCEYWSSQKARWVKVDAQLDPLHMEELKISFDPTDVPDDQFLYAGKAWDMCREEGFDPDTFGIFDLGGYDFIIGNIVRDILALNKIEVLPWDSGWGILKNPNLKKISNSLLLHMDKISESSINSSTLSAISIFKEDDMVRLPQGWDFSLSPSIARLKGFTHA